MISPFLILLFLFLCTIIVLFLQTRRKDNIPPSPLKLPFIGNLHQIGSNLHRSLTILSHKHGPLMMLQLGQVQTLVVSSPELAKNILRTNDHVFASRPSLKIANILLYGSKDIVLAPYGEYWRVMRKHCTVNLFSSKELKSFQQAREEEVAFMVDKINASFKRGLVVDMSKVLHDFSNDVICRAVLGKGHRVGKMNQVLNDMIELNVELLGEFYVEDYFPSLGWIEEIFGVSKRAHLHSKKWDDLLDKIIEDHVDASKHGYFGERERDFVDALLSVQQESSGDEKISREDIKAILIDIFAAGIDTTYIGLVWTMTQLVRNPRVMKKLQHEVRAIAKGNGLVKHEDVKEMSYLKAVIKESLRLHPPAPLLIIRESMEDCNVENYLIPKKTRVIVNAWAIHRGEKYWDEPDEFKPERFLMDNELDYKGNHFQFIPFGSGRRICPGMQFASQSLELVIANLVHRFDWELPHGLKIENMDMNEIPGMTTRRKQSLLLVAQPCFN